SGLSVVHRNLIVTLAARHKLPAVHLFPMSRCRAAKEGLGQPLGGRRVTRVAVVGGPPLA
ncbi:MAG: hypothetical protein WCF62_27825, partial [Pseudolabrys sp.]